MKTTIKELEKQKNRYYKKFMFVLLLTAICAFLGTYFWEWYEVYEESENRKIIVGITQFIFSCIFFFSKMIKMMNKTIDLQSEIEKINKE